jgi:DNA gyrase subunit A
VPQQSRAATGVRLQKLDARDRLAEVVLVPPAPEEEEADAEAQVEAEAGASADTAAEVSAEVETSPPAETPEGS